MRLFIPGTVPARSLLTGIAAITLAASSALAQPQDKGQGNGGGGGNGGPGHSQQANGNGGNDAGPPARGNGPANDRSNGSDKGPAAKPGPQERGNGRGPGNGRAGDESGNRDGRSNETARENDADRVPNGALKGNGRSNGNAMAGRGNNGNDRARSDIRGNGNRGNGNRGNERQSAPLIYGQDRAGVVFARNDRSIRDHGLLQGCPPGLAKKRTGCTPPGLDRRDTHRYDNAGWWGLPGLNDGRYRYYDGNLVRLSDIGSIIGYYPLLGGALSVGNVWPDWYDANPLPRYTQDFYSLGPGYRYADNVVYRTDPDSNAITSIAALLTGNDFSVGQRMPAGYDVYNVPYGYRDQYRDGPDARYRYSDGYVYQVDPTSQLIVAAIELLT